MSFAGVIFDMDGVLCDSEDFMAEAAAAMFAETYKVTVAVEEFRPFRGMGEDRYLGNVLCTCFESPCAFSKRHQPVLASLHGGI